MIFHAWMEKPTLQAPSHGAGVLLGANITCIQLRPSRPIYAIVHLTGAKSQMPIAHFATLRFARNPTRTGKV